MADKCLNRNFHSQSGQAVVEYVLVLVVVVSIIVGVLFQFNRAFRTYTRALFVDYIACLIEAGELPGGSAECSQLAPKLNFAADQSSGSSGRSGGGSSSSSSSGQSKSASNRSDNNSASRSGSETGGTPNGERGGSAGGARVSRNLSSSGSRGDSTTAPKPPDEGNLKSDVVRLGRAAPIAGAGADKKIPLTGLSGYLAEEEAKRKEKPGKLNLGTTEDQLRPSISRYKVGERKPAATISDDGLSFADILRILMIIIIIIALIVFFGGQIMNYSKSQEK